MTITDPLVDQRIKEAHLHIQNVKTEMAKIIVGQHLLIESLLIGLLTNSHILLEGVPGVAKTLAANTLAQTISCDFKRIQFTPDLLPADLIGTTIYNAHNSSFEVKKGPIFTNLLLADEINRAPSKVQSALLEIMQERQVTISDKTFHCSFPFLVIATQNPLEQEGTYPLAEAQMDRFLMKIIIDYPSLEEEKVILKKMANSQSLPNIQNVLSIENLKNIQQLLDAIHIDDRLIDYILRIIDATRHPTNYQLEIKHYINYGASPRASIGLKKAAKAKALLAGRYFVTPQDIKECAYTILRHRLHLTYEAEADNLNADQIIDKILNKLPIP